MERTVDALGKEGRGEKKISAQSSSKVRPPGYHDNGNGGQSPVGGLGTTARLPKNVTMATTATRQRQTTDCYGDRLGQLYELRSKLSHGCGYRIWWEVFLYHLQTDYYLGFDYNTQEFLDTQNKLAASGSLFKVYVSQGTI